MKISSLLSAAAFALVGSLSQNAMATEAKVFKTLDGSVVLCGSQKSLPSAPGTKSVLVELVSQNADQKSLGTSLKVSVVKCDGEKWVLDSNPGYEKYTAPNGETVEVQYSDYEALVVSKDLDVISVDTLADLNKLAAENFSTSIAKSNENPQDLEVVVRAKKTVKASGGYTSTSVETFGSFRLRITE